MTEEPHEQWHLAVSRELDARVKNRMFFLRVTVSAQSAQDSATRPTDIDQTAWEGMAEAVEQWLDRLDPDAVDQDNLPEQELRPADRVSIQLAAIPKKPKRRGSDPLVVNPFPGIVVFTGSYTTGPPPEFDDGT